MPTKKPRVYDTLKMGGGAHYHPIADCKVSIGIGVIIIYTLTHPFLLHMLVHTCVYCIPTPNSKSKLAQLRF